jgi:hypothetical protein
VDLPAELISEEDRAAEIEQLRAASDRLWFRFLWYWCAPIFVAFMAYRGLNALDVVPDNSVLVVAGRLLVVDMAILALALRRAALTKRRLDALGYVAPDTSP